MTSIFVILDPLFQDKISTSNYKFDLHAIVGIKSDENELCSNWCVKAFSEFYKEEYPQYITVINRESLLEDEGRYGVMLSKIAIEGGNSNLIEPKLIVKTINNCIVIAITYFSAPRLAKLLSNRIVNEASKEKKWCLVKETIKLVIEIFFNWSANVQPTTVTKDGTINFYLTANNADALSKLLLEACNKQTEPTNINLMQFGLGNYTILVASEDIVDSLKN